MSKALPKSALIAQVARELEMTQAASGRVIDAFLAAIQESLARGERIMLTGFGSFSVRHRKATERANPQTGERFISAAHKVAKFTPASTLRERIRRS